MPSTITMKRKLDANDVPSPDAAGAEEQELDFEALNLDPRLRQALIKEKFTKPTLVQSKAHGLVLGHGLSMEQLISAVPIHRLIRSVLTPIRILLAWKQRSKLCWISGIGKRFAALNPCLC